MSDRKWALVQNMLWFHNTCARPTNSDAGALESVTSLLKKNKIPHQHHNVLVLLMFQPFQTRGSITSKTEVTEMLKCCHELLSLAWQLYVLQLHYHPI